MIVVVAGDGGCVEKMSGSLYRAVEGMAKQTPDRDIFVAMP